MQYAMLHHNVEIVLWPQITVRSPHPVYSVLMKRDELSEEGL